MIVANIRSSLLVIIQSPGPHLHRVSFCYVGSLPMKEEDYLVEHRNCGVNGQKGNAADCFQKGSLLIAKELTLPQRYKVCVDVLVVEVDTFL